jgi:hypothetical protein
MREQISNIIKSGGKTQKKKKTFHHSINMSRDVTYSIVRFIDQMVKKSFYMVKDFCILNCM